MTTAPNLETAALDAAWAEFRSNMEPEDWRLADPLRIYRLRKIIAAALASSRLDDSPGDEAIACRVAVAPATFFGPGSSLATVVACIKMRSGAEGAPFDFNAGAERKTGAALATAPRGGPFGYVTRMGDLNATRRYSDDVPVYTAAPAAPADGLRELVEEYAPYFAHARVPGACDEFYNRVAALLPRQPAQENGHGR